MSACAGVEAHRRGNPLTRTCYVLEADDELEPEVLGLDVEVLVVVDVVELGAAAAVGAGVVVELAPPPSGEVDAFVLSVVEATGFSEVSLPEPGFILSE
jgi:hypothetical protein